MADLSDEEKRALLSDLGAFGRVMVPALMNGFAVFDWIRHNRRAVKLAQRRARAIFLLYEHELARDLSYLLTTDPPLDWWTAKRRWRHRSKK